MASLSESIYLFSRTLSMAFFRWDAFFVITVEIVYNETGYNEQPDITSKFGAEVWSRI